MVSPTIQQVTQSSSRSITSLDSVSWSAGIVCCSVHCMNRSEHLRVTLAAKIEVPKMVIAGPRCDHLWRRPERSQCARKTCVSMRPGCSCTYESNLFPV
jgi:hypothetical protein